MEIKQALNLIEQVIVSYKGTRQEHALLQQAMELIKKELSPKKEEKK